MTTKIRKFFAKLRFTWFMFRCDKQVHQIFAQLQGRGNSGFPFSTATQMNQQTEARDLKSLIDLIAAQSPEMGRAYGDAFRYLMHRDIYERLEYYVRHIQRNIPRESRIAAFAR